MNTIDYIVIHCSDSPNDRDIDAAEVHRWHLKKHWDGIGYHFVILRSGNLERGRPIYWQGAHVRRYNHNSIGICLIGRDSFDDEQLRTLRVVVGELKYKFRNAEVVGHRDLDPAKLCPNFNVKTWWKG